MDFDDQLVEIRLLVAIGDLRRLGANGLLNCDFKIFEHWMSITRSGLFRPEHIEKLKAIGGGEIPMPPFSDISEQKRQFLENMRPLLKLRQQFV